MLDFPSAELLSISDHASKIVLSLSTKVYRAIDINIIGLINSLLQIEEAEDNFERLINLFNASLIRQGRHLAKSDQIIVQPVRETKLTREQMIEKVSVSQ